VRARRSLSTLPEIYHATWLPCDLDDRQALLDAAAGSQVIVHALNPPYTNKAWTEQAPAMMRQAIDIAADLGALLMFPGNVYNFGEGMPTELTEDTPQRATHAKGRVRIALEQQLAREAREGKVRAVVIRAGDFFGSGRGSMFDLALAKDLPKGKMTLPGDLAIATPWAYLPDLARTFAQVAECREALDAYSVYHFRGHILNGNDWREVLGAVAAKRGWVGTAATPPANLKLAHYPWGFIRLGAPLVPLWRSLADMRYLGQHAHTLVNSRLVSLLGAEPHTPLDAAVEAAIDELFPQEDLAGMLRVSA